MQESTKHARRDKDDQRTIAMSRRVDQDMLLRLKHVKKSICVQRITVFQNLILISRSTAALPVKTLSWSVVANK